MEALIAEAGKMGKPMDTASALDLRAKANTPGPGHTGSR